jgi:hypothetical protein
MAHMSVPPIRLGDWVSGTTPNDERIIGFVEAMPDVNGKVSVFVTGSDRTEAIGTVVQCNLGKISSLPEQAPYLEDELTGLIDLALQTRDEPWFRELTEMLLGGQERKKSFAADTAGFSGKRRIFID